ncbi:MAG: trypsin-like peptidase domain-containing protein [Planctomycetes bacterium]|nr:trypsin-like peptidase domain-containing protein [Planctomycetota bacterium]
MERSISKRMLASACFAALALSAFAAPIQANPDVYRKMLDASFLVFTESGSGGTGSLIYVERNLVVTANHVVEGNEWVWLIPATRDENGNFENDPEYYAEHPELRVRAKVVATDRATDLALLEPASIPSGMKPLSLARKSPKTGDVVFVVGNSDIDQGMLFGFEGGKILSNKFQQWTYDDGRKCAAKRIDSAVDVESGDSGGPVCNAAGELVGVHSGATTSVDREGHREVRSYEIEVSELLALLEGEDDRDEEAPARPVARVVKVEVEHGVVVDGQEGMRIRVWLEIDGGQGNVYQVVARFVDAEGRPLLCEDEEFSMPGNGQLAVFLEIEPEHEEAAYDEMELFIPYSVLEGVLGRTATEFSFLLNVWSDEDGAWIVEKSHSWGLNWCPAPQP